MITITFHVVLWPSLKSPNAQLLWHLALPPDSGVSPAPFTPSPSVPCSQRWPRLKFSCLIKSIFYLSTGQFGFSNGLPSTITFLIFKKPNWFHLIGAAHGYVLRLSLRTLIFNIFFLVQDLILFPQELVFLLEFSTLLSQCQTKI